jgi:SM-20-related protein
MNTAIYETLIDQLIEKDWGFVDNFLPDALVQTLLENANTRYERQEFKPAGIGKNHQHQLNQTVRSDSILWLDEHTPALQAAEKTFLAELEKFTQYLNRTCFLGLREAEIHYARYAEGSFYKKHLDQFQAEGRRKISLIFYLNPDWLPEYGGALRIYPSQAADNTADILPMAGRLVCFKSELVPHEVLVTHRTRNSITGWLKG